jgi:hypothetical protein
MQDTRQDYLSVKRKNKREGKEKQGHLGIIRGMYIIRNHGFTT